MAFSIKPYITDIAQRARPTTIQHPNGEERLWHPRDSVIGSTQSFKDQPKYDSDDQSSLVSEPGSPQALSQVSEEDVSMLSDDDLPRQASTDISSSPSKQNWRSQLRGERAPTPGLSPKLGQRLLTSHVRSRHPQENLSSDRLEVPSPIDEDEVPTPPSAAEAAGSQLELLSVDDVEMSDQHLPTISIQTERSMQLDGMDDRPETSNGMLIRKTRARSGALSASGSPLRESPGLDAAFTTKKGFSMGYRADCEKCRQKVPGHMNHFY